MKLHWTCVCVILLVAMLLAVAVGWKVEKESTEERLGRVEVQLLQLQDVVRTQQQQRLEHRQALLTILHALVDHAPHADAGHHLTRSLRQLSGSEGSTQQASPFPALYPTPQSLEPAWDRPADYARASRSDDQDRMGAVMRETLQKVNEIDTDMQALKNAKQAMTDQIRSQLSQMSKELETLKHASEVPTPTSSCTCSLPLGITENVTQLMTEMKTLNNTCQLVPGVIENITQLTTDVNPIKDMLTVMPHLQENLTQLTSQVDSMEAVARVVDELTHNRTDIRQDMNQVLTDMDLLKARYQQVSEIAHNLSQVQTQVDLMNSMYIVVSNLTDNITVVSSRLDNLSQVYTAMEELKHNVSTMVSDVQSIKDVCHLATNLTHLSANLTHLSMNVTHLTMNMTHLSTSVANLSTNVTHMSTNLTNLSTNVTHLSSNLTDLSTNVTHMSTNVTHLSTNLTHLHTNLTAMSANLTQLSGAMAFLQGEVDALSNKSCCLPGDVAQHLQSMAEDIKALQNVTSSPATFSSDALPAEVAHNLTQAMAQIHRLNVSRKQLVANLSNWLQGNLLQLGHEIDALKFAIHYPNLSNPDLLQQSASAGGSVYVRWGHARCPDKAQLVYSGYLGGGGTYDVTGAPPNRLCLTRNPINDHREVNDTRFAELYGGSYETLDDNYNMDPLCAVCRTPRATSIMVPGTSVCPDHWTLEYYGYLMGSSGDHATGADFICVDIAQESRADSFESEVNNVKASELFLTKVACGSLPCLPYHYNALVMCAVCSK